MQHHHWITKVQMYLFLLLACSCVLSQGLPITGNQLFPVINTPERHKRDTDDSCVLDNERTIFVGQSISQLAYNDPSSITSVDLCLVISGTTTMPFSEKWVQFLSTSLNNKFKAVGIGSQTGNENRFCVIQFGGRSEDLRARIIKVDDKVFFDADIVKETRSELKRNGYVADGYEALEFAINNIPFRDSLSVAKGFILVTDTGRSMLADRVNLTKPIISHLLEEKNITLDVISNINVESQLDRVLGILDYHTKVVYKNGVTYIEDNEQVKIVSSHGDSLTSYAELAFHTGGGAWLLDTLYEDIKSLSYKDYINGIAIEYVNSRSYLKSNVCEICSCVSEKSEPLLKCERPNNQRHCLGKHLATESVEGNPLQIFATVSQQPEEKNVNISFHGNSGDMVYECVLVNSTISHCVSPVILTGLATGKYEFLIIGRTTDGASMTSKIVHFVIPPNANSVLSIKVIKQTTSDDSDYTTVSFQTTPSYAGSHVTITCQIDDEQYEQCTSPLMIKRSIGWQRLLTLIATDEFGGTAVTQETVYFPGKNMFTLTKGGIDSHGTVELLLQSSNDPVVCICIYDGKDESVECTPQSKGKVTQIYADPKVHGNGVHNLNVACMYKSATYHYGAIEFHLRSEEAKNIKCSLNINGPFTNNTAVADFNCDQQAISTSCTIDSLPVTNCSTGYTFNTDSLLPGYHLFTLTAFDSISQAEHVTIEPFFVNTSTEYHCCPKIIQNNSKIVNKDGNRLTVSLATTAGNCTSREEFSYNIKWGDGASHSGITAGHITPLIFSRTFPSAGQYTATLEYCTNPHNSQLRCCDTLMLPLATS